MSHTFEMIEDGIWQLKIPFENIYTSVFALCVGKTCMLVDCASNEYDVKHYIVPAILKAGFLPEILMCSHTHGDHAGGMDALIRTFPEASVVLWNRDVQYECEHLRYLEEGEILLERFEVLNLRGHCPDSVALYDKRTGTLISFDSLQQWGITRYGSAVTNYRAYLEGIERVRRLSPNKIYASHDYMPLGATAIGTEQVNKFLDCCVEDMEHIRLFAETHSALSDDEVAALFNRDNPDHPTIHGYTIQTVRNQ